jgi:hypothetical protein
MDNMVLQKLGPVAPGPQGKEGTKSNKDMVDPNPIVLWSGNKPAAILYLRQKEGTLEVEQTFAKMTGDALGAGVVGGMFQAYPIRFRDLVLTEAVTQKVPNSYLSERLATADVNGDGVDELILPRLRGGIEVYSTEKQLHSFSGEGHLPHGYFYVPDEPYIARLKGRDVVFFTSKLDNPVKGGKDTEPGPETPRYAVYRIDNKGIARVTLRGTAALPDRIAAFGALSRPGSNDIDELLIVAPPGADTGTTLLRYRPDGTAIGEGREFPGDMGSWLAFLSAPGSPYAILRDDAKIHFISPEKPFNWVQTVDFELLGGKNSKVDVLHVTDAKSDPKVVVSIRRRLPDGHVQEAVELFAVNAEGHCFAPMPGGQGWRLLPGLEAYHRIAPPSPLHEWVDIIPASDGSEDLLVVYSRKAQTKKLTHEEILAAAEKFLMPAVLQEFRQELVVRIEHMKVGGEEWPEVKDEKRAKGTAEAIASAEDWKRLLPESYASAQDRRATYAYEFLENRLLLPLNDNEPLSPDRCRSPDEYHAWLTEQAIGPQTRFTLLRGEVVTSWEIEAAVRSSRDAVVPSGPVVFRSTKNGITIIFSADASKVPEPLTPTSLPEGRLPGFFLLAPSTEAR